MSDSREILFFARVAELAGCRSVTGSFGANQSVAELKNWVLSRYPKLNEIIESCAWAVDNEVVPLGQPIGTGSQIALLPPVSGG
jgi:molybdopterin converting factor subunit 1